MKIRHLQLNSSFLYTSYFVSCSFLHSFKPNYIKIKTYATAGGCGSQRKQQQQATTSALANTIANNLQKLNPTIASHTFDFFEVPDDFTQLLKSRRLAYNPLDYLKVYPNFINSKEHQVLVNQAQAKVQRLCRGPYLEGHFDKVIKGYKECSVSSWMGKSFCRDDEQQDLVVISVLDRAKQLIEANLSLSNMEFNNYDADSSQQAPSKMKWLAPHILELRGEDSGIAHHVDHLQASGNIVTGVCLLSSSVMEFQHQTYPEIKFKTLLPEKSLYFQQLSMIKRHKD